MKQWALPPEARLRKGYQYRTVRTQGSIKHGRYLRLSYYRQEVTSIQCGFIVSKKVGNAVNRNRIKRHLREYYRHSRPQLLLSQGAYWLVVICKKEAANASPQELHTDWIKLLKKLPS